jgi:hypothetical protein
MNPFSNLIEGVTFVWPNAIFIAGVFSTLLFRPERIANRTAFKVGCVFFAISLLTPPFVSLVPTFSVQEIPVPRSQAGSLMPKLLGLGQPIAFSIAFLCLAWSLLQSSGGSNE